MKKIKISLSLQEDTLKKIKSIQDLDGSATSRNAVLEKAVDFYFAYRTSELNQDYLCTIFAQKMEGLIGNSTDRLARLAFKEAVEINLMSRCIASHFDIDKDTYDRMRLKAVSDAKETKGIISIYEANS
ncbi:MAG: hypothetical protein ACI4G1_00645 [Ruminococcus sp.]